MSDSTADVKRKIALLAMLVLNDAERDANERRQEKEWTKRWIKRRTAGRGVLSMLDSELRLVRMKLVHLIFVVVNLTILILMHNFVLTE